MNFLKEPQFDFGKRKENSNVPKILILPSEGDRNSDNLPFIEDYDPEVDLPTVLDAQLKIEDNLSEKDLDEFEKKRVWAEKFLATYYEMKDMLKKREIEEKEMKNLKEKKEMEELKEKKKMKDFKEIEKVQKKRKEQIAKDETQDMKAMILNLL